MLIATLKVHRRQKQVGRDSKRVSIIGDRQWLFTEFSELLMKSHEQFSMLEVGCGVGNCVFPILRTNDKSKTNLFIYCCDYSSEAIDLLCKNDEYDSQRCKAFVCDLTDEQSNIKMPFEENSLDAILMIFVLSAIHPSKFEFVIRNLFKYLKPNGKLLFRDYGLYDLAQLRFKNDKCLEKNLYARQDGTLVYFFTQDELDSLFVKCGFIKEQNIIDRRLQVNRSTKQKMYQDHELENFYGCYLLQTLNPKCKGRTYIGFTVDPNRRFKQHNLGLHFGGAKKTSGKGPWEMVLIVHGFPNEISALRFEWAWQNPEQSVRLKYLALSNTKKFSLKFKLMILSEMLSIGPWTRLPLTVRWLQGDLMSQLPKSPPIHMPITYGPINVSKQTSSVPSRRKKKHDSDNNHQINTIVEYCSMCKKNMDVTSKLNCPKCLTSFHILCLSRHFLSNDTRQMLPIEGTCPQCLDILLWGEIIQYKWQIIGYSTKNKQKEGKQNKCSDIDDEH
ncbi:unnamed protein product [Didymodactylos carnosus]|uniref:Structure-specific endonuclease subunit SLX1 homolog n=1 Tax=Didymodactylos carnosus TaxID=1234261 RepID=A0A8S2DKS4_9BILA|nr:unnamed protein product [Didymodactylos carnosus]CAF3699011.1 unnamed protein product [Didymodactylos carnosus]